MSKNFTLKRLLSSQHHIAREIYADAIETQAQFLYSPEQIRAWSSLAWLPGVLDRPLKEGKGWVSIRKNEIEAFALRYPLNRLALIYCRGRSARSGQGTALLDCLEAEALKEGQQFLLTEASLMSYKLLLRRNWEILSPQIINIAGVTFQRFLMKKELR